MSPAAASTAWGHASNDSTARPAHAPATQASCCMQATPAQGFAVGFADRIALAVAPERAETVSAPRAIPGALGLARAVTPQVFPGATPESQSCSSTTKSSEVVRPSTINRAPAAPALFFTRNRVGALKV